MSRAIHLVPEHHSPVFGKLNPTVRQVEKVITHNNIYIKTVFMAQVSCLCFSGHTHQFQETPRVHSGRGSHTRYHTSDQRRTDRT